MGEGDGEEEEEGPTCYFHNKEGFKCVHDDNTLRTCFGVSGNAQKSTCKKNGDDGPYMYHHMCFVAFYKDKRNKELQDDEDCNRCPECMPPKLKRKARAGA